MSHCERDLHSICAWPCIVKAQVSQQQARPGGDVTDGPHKPAHVSHMFDPAPAHTNVKVDNGAWKCVDVQNWITSIGLAKFAKRLVG